MKQTVRGGPFQRSAANVQMTDTLASNLQFGSAASTVESCAQTGSTVARNLGSLSNGASVTVTIIVTSKKTGTLTNTVQVSSSSPDPNAANNTDIEQTTIVR